MPRDEVVIVVVHLQATAPVLVSPDVGATAKWYEDHLRFKAALFPDQAPFELAILFREGIEIMIQRCAPAGLTRPAGDWHVYVRTRGVRELYEQLQGRVLIVDSLSTKRYGCVEFVVEDPNGFRLVFSEEPLPC
jgi:hypothetical protein